MIHTQPVSVQIDCHKWWRYGEIIDERKYFQPEQQLVVRCNKLEKKKDSINIYKQSGQELYLSLQTVQTGTSLVFTNSPNRNFTCLYIQTWQEIYLSYNAVIAVKIRSETHFKKMAEQDINPTSINRRTDK